MYVVLPGSGCDEWKPGHRVARSVRGRLHRSVSFCDEMQELQVGWDGFNLAPRREHVVRNVEIIVLPAVVLAEHSLSSCTEWGWILHRKETPEKFGSEHRHPSASDVRMRNSVRIDTSAIALRIPMWCAAAVPPLF